MALRADGRVVSPVPWLLDDTEESVLGTAYHQKAISVLALTLEDLAAAYEEPWGIGEQMGLEGLLRPDGSPYHPMPDVFVHPRRFDGNRSSLSIEDDGPPTLVIEVASPSTAANDVGDKVFAYGVAGVQEYIVFDPAGDLIGEPVRAWRIGPGTATGAGLDPWLPDEQGRWQSRGLRLAFAPIGVLLRIYDRDGRLVDLPSVRHER